MELTTNALYFGDNLDVLRKHIPDESVDLIYLDPPFNSQASYNLLFKEQSGALSQAQITAFEDSWKWGIESELALSDITQSLTAPQSTKEFVSVLPNFVGQRTPMRAYLTMMAIRLVELRRVLKKTGSIYLHCDPTASHYLKIMLDTIFDPNNFQNEIVWLRSTGHSDSHTWNHSHDVILFYSKTKNFKFNPQYIAYSDQHIDSSFKYVEKNTGRHFSAGDLMASGLRNGESGKIWRGIDPAKRNGHWQYTVEKLDELEKEGRIYWPIKGQVPRLKRYLDEMPGRAVKSIWDDIPPVMGRQKLGYPTQKPIALLERILQASSNEGDIVLDPFCGCGTALVASQKLKRKWIGIDITFLAVYTMKWRLDKMFPGIKYKVIGEPVDLEGAKALAQQDKYQFQWWAVSLIGGQPYGDKKKGSDTGIDGYLYFQEWGGAVKKAIISVKGGHVQVSQVRELNAVVKREKAEMGIFITLEDKTLPMEQEAILEGFYYSSDGKKYPKIQILSIAELLNGWKKPDIPSWVSPISTPDIAKEKAESPKMF